MGYGKVAARGGKYKPRAEEAQVQVQSSLETSYLNLGKLFPFFRPHFSYLQNGRVGLDGPYNIPSILYEIEILLEGAIFQGENREEPQVALHLLCSSLWTSPNVFNTQNTHFQDSTH